MSDIYEIPDVSLLGTTTREILAAATELHERGVRLVVAGQAVDTTIAVLIRAAEYQRRRAGTTAGLAAARARGRRLGARPKLSPAQVAELRAAWSAGEGTAAELAERFGISKPTLFRHLDPDRQRRAPGPKPR